MKNIYYSLLLICAVHSIAHAQINRDGNCSPGVYSPDFFAPDNSLIRSTVRFQVIEGGVGRGLCTGSLINQLVDGKPRQLFITARHCIHGGENGEGPLFNLNDVEFVFNFQSSNGNTASIPNPQPLRIGNVAYTANRLTNLYVDYKQ